MAKIRRIARVAQAFTPSVPVSSLDMLAGRTGQILEVATAATQRGRHVALYGERGVGKTSLANVLREFFGAEDLPSFQAAIVNCSTDDTYASLWQRILAELDIEMADYEIQPDAVRRKLEQLPLPALLVIDELDRLEDDLALSLIADTIKSLSDHSVESTVVLVGVARSIGELIGEHQSIARALAQIEMPRMSRAELREALKFGCEQAQLTIREDAADEITALSEGLPHTPIFLAFTRASGSFKTTVQRSPPATLRPRFPRPLPDTRLTTPTSSQRAASTKTPSFSMSCLPALSRPRTSSDSSRQAQSAIR